MEFLCEFHFEIKHVKGKENKVFDALNRKVHEMDFASLIIFQSNLRQLIVNHIVEDEMYVQIKDTLQRENLENMYEGYHLEGDGIPIYKTRIYIPNVADLRRIVMDEIHKMPYFSHPGYHKTVVTSRKQYFLDGNEIGNF